MKKEYTNKQRKIWKLKRKNVVLGQWKEQLLQKGVDETNLNIKEAVLPCCLDILDVYRISQLSFQIGKNSAKIQRLRTLIQQEKKANELYDIAKEKSAPVVEKAAKEVKETALKAAKEVVSRLETEEKKPTTKKKTKVKKTI